MNFGKINFRKYKIWGIFMRPKFKNVINSVNQIKLCVFCTLLLFKTMPFILMLHFVSRDQIVFTPFLHFYHQWEEGIGFIWKRTFEIVKIIPIFVFLDKLKIAVLRIYVIIQNYLLLKDLQIFRFVFNANIALMNIKLKSRAKHM